MSTPAKRRDAFPAYSFAIEIEGVMSAFFRSCSGLKSEAEVVSIQEGGVNDHEHKLIGRTKYPNLVLKQGFADPTLWLRRLSFVDDEPKAGTVTTPDGQSFTVMKRFNGTIIQYGPGQKPAHKWQFVKGWICKWEGPELDAGKNEISLESIEIAHEGLIYQKG